jgi:CheY-like chemotaxis protein
MMSGYEVLRAKALDPLIRQIPVIAVTAQDPTQRPSSVHPIVFARGGGLAFTELLDHLLKLGAALATPSQIGDREPPAASCG